MSTSARWIWSRTPGRSTIRRRATRAYQNVAAGLVPATPVIVMRAHQAPDDRTEADRPAEVAKGEEQHEEMVDRFERRRRVRRGDRHGACRRGESRSDRRFYRRVRHVGNAIPAGGRRLPGAPRQDREGPG